MKILWISPFFLHPTDRGGQIRSLGTLKELHRRHEIHFAALNNPANTEGPDRSRGLQKGPIDRGPRYWRPFACRGR